VSIKQHIYSVIALAVSILPARFVAQWVINHLSLVRKNSGPKVIVLDSGRFRDDLWGMVNFSTMELYELPKEIQDRITRFVYYRNLRGDNEASDPQKTEFLENVLRSLRKQMNAAAIISAAVYYKRNVLWERACQEIGFPFVCLHRESAAEDPETLEKLVKENRLELHREFFGHRIFAGSEHFKKALVESGYADAEKVIVTGLPRFDISHYWSSQINRSTEKCILLFSFMPAFSVPEVYEELGVHVEAGFVELFYSVHRAIASLAVRNPEVKFVIKPKWYVGAWKEFIDKAVAKETNALPTFPSNLLIDDNEMAQDLINKASLIVAFNSTTIVEAILQERIVLVPWYAEALEKYSHNVFYRKYENAFLTAKSEEEFENTIQAYINGTLVDESDSEEFISNVMDRYDGKASARIESTILSLQSLG